MMLRSGLTRRTAGRLAALIALAPLLVLAAAPAVALPLRAPAPRTVVSLTFDDSTADQRDGARILQSHGLVGTFYVISGYIGQPGYLTRSDLDQLAAAGDEVGGHTVDHPYLTRLPTDEARREICVDRQTLRDWGFHPVSFAYPFDAYDQTIAKLVQECGYTSARALGDLRSDRGCPDCDIAETIPPAKPFEVQAADPVGPSWTAADLEALVLNAERSGGGWLPLVFHQICDGCSEYGMKAQVLDDFTTWLAGRATRGTVVRTVGQVVGGTAKTVPDVGFGRPATPVNPDLERVGGEGVPECWEMDTTGQGDVASAVVDQAHSGTHAMRIDLRNHRNGDAKLLTHMDLGTCAPAAEAGRAYELSAWYRSDVRVQFVAYTRDAAGRWSYWTSGPFLPPGAAWTEARWTTPATPPGTTGLSYGLSLQDDGFLVTDDYGMAPAPPPAPVPAAAAAQRPVTVAGYGVVGVAALVLLWGLGRRVVRRPHAGDVRSASARPPGDPVAPFPSGRGGVAR